MKAQTQNLKAVIKFNELVIENKANTTSESK